MDVKREGVRTPDLVQVSKELISKYVEERDIIKVKKLDSYCGNYEKKKEYAKNNYAWEFLLCRNMQELKRISRK